MSVNKYTITAFSYSLPSHEHPARNEDLIWSAAHGLAYAVIDGIGGIRRTIDVASGEEIGGEHGAIALARALDARLSDLPEELGVREAGHLLTEVVAEACATIYRELNLLGEIPASQIPDGQTGADLLVGAVMTALVFCDGGDRIVIGQNGDTRAYLLAEGELVLLTEDQDAIGWDVINGELTSEEAKAIRRELDDFEGDNMDSLSDKARYYFGRRNLVFGQIGSKPEARPPVLVQVDVRADSMLLLCSDGLYNNLTNAEIRACWLQHEDDTAKALVEAAYNRAGERAGVSSDNTINPTYNCRARADDITALVLKISDLRQ